ncbi:MAG: beta-lactamase family protein [Clostridia bacterium]|nr:beta-lactamase family protein [Clostridia bacterium]
MISNLLKQVNEITEKHHYNGVILIDDFKENLLVMGYGYSNLEHDIQMTVDTPMRIASITKQFTAISIVQLFERGLLHLEDNIKKYIPDYPRGDEITIHHLLTHTSGISNFPLSYDFYEVLNSDSVLEALIDLFKFEPLQFNPGSQFSYSISGFLILQYIIEQVSQMSYEAYLQANIFDPLNMKNSGFDHYKAIIKGRASPYDFKEDHMTNADFIDMRIAGAGGGLYASITDLERFNKGILNHVLITEDSMKMMFHHQYEIAEEVYSGYGVFIQTCELVGRKRIKAYHAGGGTGVRAMNIFYFDDEIMLTMVSNINDAKRFNETLNEIELLILKDQ